MALKASVTELPANTSSVPADANTSAISVKFPPTTLKVSSILNKKELTNKFSGECGIIKSK